MDLDGTLIDSERAYAVALSAVDVDPLGDPYLSARAAVKERLTPGNPGARNRILYFKELLLRSGTYSAKKLLEMVEKYEAVLEIEIRNQWQKLERAAFFERIARRFKIVILTNENTRTQTIKMRAIDPHSKFFPAVLTSEELGFEKPHPALFQASLRWAAEPSSACVMIGDDLEADILSAQMVGIGGILTTEFARTAPQTPDGIQTVSRLEQIEGLLC